MKKIILFFCAAIILVSCSSNCDLAIDNPTDRIVSLYVDSLYVEVPAKEVVWVEMGRGKHTITLESDSVINFNFTEPVYMVNPAGAAYFMYEEMYGSSNPMLMAVGSPIPNQKINYLGMELEGNYAVVDQVINKVSWDYGPREPAPEMIEIEQGDRPSIIKLMDPYEFINKMMEGAAENTGE